VALLDGSGTWDFTSGGFSSLNTLTAKILDPFDTGGTFPADMNPVVYSRTRRARGFDPFTFKLTNVVPSDEPRWLRRRSPA
jgi:hypothetical protein